MFVCDTRKWFSAVVVVVISCVGLWSSYEVEGTADWTLSQSDISKIRTFLEHVRRCRHIPSLAVAVAGSQGSVMEQTFGLADIEEDRAPTRDTLYPIGSTTKAFTTMLLAMLIDDKVANLSWDSRVRDLMGEDFYMYNDILTYHMTLRDLLAHATGIPDIFLPLMAIVPKTQDRASFVSRLKYHKPIHGFREKFEYNNYMYVLAGHIAERLTGETWEDLVRQRILTPLGMRTTTFVSEVPDWRQVASSYVRLDNGTTIKINKTLTRQTDLPGPAGSMLSTPHDMGLWLQFLINKGVTSSGRRLVTLATFDSIFHEQMSEVSPMSDRDLVRPSYPVPDITAAYDLGWITSYYRGYKKIWHSGGVTTYKSQVWFYPDINLGLFVASTGPPLFETTVSLQLILHYITDVVLQREPWLNATTACSFPHPWKQPKQRHPPAALPDDAPPLQHSAYTGTYSHPGFGTVQISYCQEAQQLKLHMDQNLDMLLYYNSSAEHFMGKLVGEYWYMTDRIEVTFSRSPGSVQIDTLHLPLLGPFDASVATEFLRGRALQHRSLDPPSMQASRSDQGAAVSTHQAVGCYLTYVPLLVYSVFAILR